jgi:3-dehydroquinate synthase
MTIRHSRGNYDIRFVSLDRMFDGCGPRDRILTDANVRQCLDGQWPQGIPTWVVPAGERSKSISEFERAVRWLANGGAGRDTRLIAVGGGVVGDLAGYVAAAFMRGIRLAQIPTSLLAQVDSSVGGKVGIDLPEGKNLVGAFHPPDEVRIPLDALRTLPENEFRAGMAEVWKYAFIADPSLVSLLEGSRLGPEDPRLESVVRRCIEIKAHVVERDEFETTGLRAILNFGHTLGHAVEQVSGYGVLHGEAVAVGMIWEARLGEQIGMTPPGTASEIAVHLASHGLSVESPYLNQVDELLAAMRKDKKAGADGLAFSLLEGIGRCKLVRGVDETEVRALLGAR